MKKKITQLVLRTAILSVCLLLTSAAFGAAISWTGGTTGTWATAASWSGTTVPGVDDDVTIPAGSTVTVLSTVAAINSLVVNGTLIISSSGSLAVNQTTSVNPLVTITGGVIDNSGSFSITQTIASNNNFALKFNDNASIDGQFKNASSGIFSVDLSQRLALQTISCINFALTTPARVAKFTCGGTINITVPVQSRVFEVSSGSVIIDGTQTFGGTSDYKDWRFIHFGGAGNLTFAPTADITLYSGFTNANGVINMSNSGVASITNKGSLTLNASTVTGSAINIQPQTSGIATFTNEGTITTTGSWAASTLYMNGNNAACTATLENKSGGTLILTNTLNTDQGGAALRVSATPTNTINNYGTISLTANSATRALYLGKSTSTFNNYGIVNTNNALTGNDATSAGVFNNFAAGTVNFNLNSDMSVAVSNNKAITFNNYGKITGKGILASGKFNCLTGTIDPGIGTGTGIFRIYDTSYNLTGKCKMQIKGTTTAGTDYDQIVFGFSPTGVVTIDPTATIEVTTAGSYMPTNLDNISLLTGYSGRTNTFTPANTTIPSDWSMDYASITAGVKYFSPITINANTNLSSLGDLSNTNVTLNSGVTITLDATTTVKSLVANPTSKITYTSGTPTFNSLTLQSNETGNATFVNTTATVLSINANVEQYLSASHAWYLSTPVSGTVSPTNLSRIQGYNEGIGTGDDWSATQTTMTALKGYITTPTSAPITTVFTGTLNSGSINIPLTRVNASDANKSGFNLIGNPYPSYLDWKAVWSNTPNQSIMPTSTMWYRTKVSGSWAFSTVNGASGEASPSDVSYKIPPMQAFWVRASTVGNSNLQLTPSMTLDESTSNLLKAPACTKMDRQLLRLKIQSSNANTDELVIYADSKASNEFDAYDSPKMSNANVLIPEIYTIVGNENLVINGLKTFSNNMIIPLGFVPGSSTSFSIQASEINNFTADTHIYLRDNMLNVQQELVVGDPYTFASDAASTIARFELIFKAPTISKAVNTASENNNLLVYRNANNQVIVNYNGSLNASNLIAVYNSVGQKLFTKKLTNNVTVIDNNFNAGVFIITVNNGCKIVTRKLIVN